jgi:hypothetical protein
MNDNDPPKPPDFQFAGHTEGVFHLLGRVTVCPKCGSTEMTVRNYDPMWHDGDVHCVKCGEYVRGYDAG